VPCKQAETAPEIYLRLAEAGREIRLAGGTCLRGLIAEHASVKLLPLVPQVDLPGFLRGLDRFLHRTSSQWYETFGRVVMDAMACRPPVVCERDSWAAEYIEHGEIGFLVETDRRVVEVVVMLKENRDPRNRVGTAARRTAEQRYNPEGISANSDFYLEGASWGGRARPKRRC
jgi:glycosyltransferase involved in cell wall biosynthesis